MDVSNRDTVGYPPVAVISIGCFFPHASGLKAYWHLLYHGKDAIGDVPSSHWSPDDYYDADPRKPDHVYCRRGGFLSPIPFDPTAFGIPPSNLAATDTSQILALLAAKTALDQAGYGEKADFERDRTAVILGVTGTQELVIPLSSRLSWPRWRRALEGAGVDDEKTRQVMERLSDSYVSWQENSFPGLLGNVVAGRICNRLNLSGTNCVVDAACASSMSAVHLALMELYTGKSRMVVTGGVDTLNDIFMHMCFARTQILSPSGDARPFSRHADGTVLGEGIGILVLKRLADAEADGDRILAVVKGIGSSSDGKSQSIYAPRAEGQLKALHQAYAAAGVAPETVELIEAHGTGTRVGDKIEIQALTQFFSPTEAPARCAIGSVKSMIGHTKAAAGAAGLIKSVLALQHKALPPTLKADEVDPDLHLDQTPFYLNTRSRPWFHSGAAPRRAGVSAFGFGGSNFHVILEEYDARRRDVAWDGSTEIAALSAATPDTLKAALQDARQALRDAPPEALPYLARGYRDAFDGQAAHRLLLVLTREEDVQGPRWNADAVCEEAVQAFEANAGADFWQTGATFYGSGPRPGGLAFLFPGQGSQYPNMGRDLAVWFPEAMEALEAANRHFQGDAPLTDLIYPLPAGAKTSREQDEALRHTAAAQPAIGAVSVGMGKILRRFGLVPEATCGHSYGELTALHSAGWIDEDSLHRLSALRGKLMAEAGGRTGESRGAMLAVKAPLEDLARLLESEKLDVVLANRNSPTQGVLSGTSEAIQHAEAVCKTHKYRTIRLPVAAAFHSRLVEAARAPFAAALEAVTFTPKATPVYSNTTGAPYPTAPEAIQALLGDHLRNPVDFIGDIEALYGQGHRIFVEVGPKGVLTGLVRAILKGRDGHALAMDAGAGKSFGILDLARLLCHLAALGCEITWEAWETREDPPPPLKMRIPVNGANQTSSTSRRGAQPRSKTRTAASRPAHPQPGDKAPATVGAATPWEETPLPPPRAAAPLHSTTTSGEASPSAFNKSEHHPVNQTNHPILQALQVVQQGLQSLQSLQAQTVEAHQKFLDTQQQASRTLQEMMESSRRFAEAALGTVPTSTAPALAPAPPAGPARPAPSPRASASENGLKGAATEAPSAPPPSAAAEETAAAPASDLPENPVAQSLLRVVSDLTGYPTEMLAMDMHIERDLGIDSIKRVEILSQLEALLPSLPPLTPDRVAEFQTLGEVAAYLAGTPAKPAPSEPPPAARDAVAPPMDTTDPNPVAATLMAVVSELTGYPVDMLTLDMDVEADLGIDSIKRVEILSALEDRMTDFPAIAPDEIAELKTLGQIAARLHRDAPPEASGPSTEASAAEASATGPATSRESVESTLMAVVSDLTGYPVDMLSVEMDIEADLGIDSIKRVEILSAMEDRLPSMPALAPEEMAGLKTLGQIAGALGSADASPPRPSAPTAPPIADAPPPPPETVLKRRVLAAVTEAHPTASALPLPTERKIFITTDKAGLSHALADRLSSKGFSTVQISIDILKHRQALPEAAGLILLGDIEGDGGGASTRLKTFLADAFELTRHVGASLQASAGQGGAFLAAVCRMDGTFGVDGLRGSHPYQGGLAGLVKTAALEWPEVACRVLDVDARWQDNPTIARQVVAELLQPAARPADEIGLARDRRVRLALQPAPLEETQRRPLALDDGDVVVLTGGARGVTAAAAEALARQQALTLILVGRSPMPFDEPDWLVGVSGETALKKAIAAHEFAAARPTPQAIEEAYRRYAGNREIRDNLTRIAATGAEVRYVSLDICDADRVRAVLNDIRLVHGPIKALVHGAGILRDHLIVDKTREEFELVFSTKVDGLENLLDATGEDPLRHIVLFSSVAARFGNIGQADYAAANEVLNKMAASMAASRGACRVRAINWGPWDGGMVTPALKKVFAERQIALIPLAQGAEAFVAELHAPQSAGTEVVIGSHLAAAAPAAAPQEPPPTEGSEGNPVHGLSTAFISELNLDHYPILDHHRLDGKPVVPFALMAEWFGHGALHNNPGLRLAGLNEMRLLKGIVLDVRQRPIRVLAGSARPNADGIEVNLELRDGVAAGAEVIHSRATALLVEQLPDPPAFTIPETLQQADYHRDTAAIYTDILFHGTALQGLQRVRACSPAGMLAELATAPDPGAWILTPPRNRWIADPLVLDGAFQMASLWCYEERGQVSLPSYSAAYRQYCRHFPAGPIRAVLVVQTASRHKLVADFTFLDRDGRVLAEIKGYEAVMEDRLMRAFKPERFAAAR